MSRIDHKKTQREQRRDQLLRAATELAGLAEHREIVPMLAGKVRHDLEIRRLLDAVLRRWSLLVPVTCATEAALALALAPKETDIEHVVPRRVLVDRMIRKPDECRSLLGTGIVLSRVTKPEHRALGGIYTHHAELYGEMLLSPVSDLPALGCRRYEAVGLELLDL
jgi:hypothetical protein